MSKMSSLVMMAAGMVFTFNTHASEKRDIAETASQAGSFKILLAAADAAGLVDTLKSPGPFTVLAPTDEAFGKLPAGTVQELL